MIYLISGLALWPIPLLNVLHVESTAILAAVVFFTAGVSSLALYRRGFDGPTVARGQLTLLVVPLAMLTVTILWVPNCSYPTGLLFFVLFPVVSVVLAVGVAFFLQAAGFSRPNLALVLGGLAVSLVGPVYDVGLHPQFYTYNHVFGGILGPLYDEELAIRSGLFAFRGLTLAWAALAVLGGIALKGPRLNRKSMFACAALSLLIAVAYTQSARLGWNTTHASIQRELTGSVHTDHFDIFFDPATIDSLDLRLFEGEVEYRYHHLSGALQEEVADRILLYLYSTARLKGELTGSFYTSITPVWLARPQIHMLQRQFEASFSHELVHVFSREFGMPALRASSAVGLIEGLAVALEAPDGFPSSVEQMASILGDHHSDSAAVVDGLAAAMGAAGFWTGRGAVSYTATGSFVRFLLDRFDVDRFKRAYPCADFMAAFGSSPADLSAQWYRDLRQVEYLSLSTLRYATQRFSIPSLFEAECPHTVPAHARSFRDGVDALARRDTAAAITLFRRSVEGDPSYAPALQWLATLRLRRGEHGFVLPLVAEQRDLWHYPTLAVLAGDAFAIAGHADSAAAYYEWALEWMPEYAHEIEASIYLRRRIASDSSVARWFLATDARGRDMPRIGGESVDPLYGALRFLRDRHYAAACDALSDWTDSKFGTGRPRERGVISRQVDLWRAEACEASGDLDHALEAAIRATQELSAAGAVNLARQAHDTAQRIRWKHSQAEVRTTGSAKADDGPVESP